MGWSCEKEKLPKPTEQGRNIFGCKIDDKVFVSKDAVTVPVLKGLTPYYDEPTRTMRINAGEPPDKDNNRYQRYVSLSVSGLQIGENHLNESNKAQLVISKINQPDAYYETDNVTGGTISITRLDTLENIISGTFSFLAAPKQNTGINIKVTDGRFDIRYTP
jgi:hypothetical protein